LRPDRLPGTAGGSGAPDDLGECLKIRNVMEAARVYTAKMRCAQEAQDTCTKIVVLAEKKVGQELIGAQQRGDFHGNQVASQKEGTANHADIGLTHKQAYEFRTMAENPPIFGHFQARYRRLRRPRRPGRWRRSRDHLIS
jgi:hypothetical protein